MLDGLLECGRRVGRPSCARLIVFPLQVALNGAVIERVHFAVCGKGGSLRAAVIAIVTRLVSLFSSFFR